MSSMNNLQSINIYYNNINYNLLDQTILDFIDARHINWGRAWRDTQTFTPETVGYNCGNNICEVNGYCALENTWVSCSDFDWLSCPDINGCTVETPAPSCQGKIDYSQMHSEAICSLYSGNRYPKMPVENSYCKPMPIQKYCSDYDGGVSCPTDYGCSTGSISTCTGIINQTTITQQQCGTTYSGAWITEDINSCAVDCPATCGDGNTEWNEKCDDGSGNSDTIEGACTTTCDGRNIPAADFDWDLGVSITPTNKTLAINGNTLWYTITYTNYSSQNFIWTSNVSILLPSELTFVDADITPTDIQYGVSPEYGIPGDICYDEMLGETGAYIKVSDRFASKMSAGAYTTFYQLLLNFPDKPNISALFMNAPFNWSIDQVGEFIDYFTKVQWATLVDFLWNVGAEKADFVWCGTWGKTQITRAIPNILKEHQWTIGITTVVHNAKTPTSTYIDTITTSTPLADIETWPYNKNPITLPDTTTLDSPISIQYHNASPDQRTLFWPSRSGLLLNSLTSIESSIFTPGMSDKEKVIALRQLFKDNTTNTDIFDILNNTPWFPDNSREIVEYTHPVAILNALYTYWGQINQAFMSLASQVTWFPVRIRKTPNQWSLYEIQIDGNRALLDPVAGVYRISADDGHILGIDELQNNPIISDNPQGNTYGIDWYITQIDAVDSTEDITLPPLEEFTLLPIVLMPNDTIDYTYSLLQGAENNDGIVEAWEWKLVRSLYGSPSVSLFKESDVGITIKDENTGIYREMAFPYLITDVEIASSDISISKDVQVSWSNGDGISYDIWSLNRATAFVLNEKSRTQNYNAYEIVFSCKSCVGDDLQNIINNIQITNKFIFNAAALPHAWALDTYLINDNVDFAGVDINYTADVAYILSLDASISKDEWSEFYIYNNESSLAIIPYSSTPIADNIVFTWDNGTVVKLYSGTTIVVYDGVWQWAPRDEKPITPSYTTSYKWLDAGDTTQGVVTLEFNGAAIFNHPIQIVIPVSAGVTSASVKADHGSGLTFDGLTTDANAICTEGLATPTYTGTPIIAVDNTITIYSCAASSFIAYTHTSSSNASAGGGGGGSLSKDICKPADCSTSYYDRNCGWCPGDTLIELATATTHSAAGMQCNQYSTELNSAYNFALANTITTIADCDKVHLDGELLRSHMAKMMTNFAMKTLWLQPNTWAVCNFTDMDQESTEMKTYAKLACQLGLMWLDTDGKVNPTFNPTEIVTRAQFGTVLSRLLRGTKNNGGDVYYTKHLQALKDAGIMTKIETPEQKELRGYTMVMLQRIITQSASIINASASDRPVWESILQYFNK